MSQIEVRMASVIFDEPELIKLCNEVGKDFHSMIASKIYNIPYDEFYKKYKAGDAPITDLRTAAKNVTFGILYQMTAMALAYRLGIPEDKAQRFIDDYFQGFPSLYKNIEKLKAFVVEYGFVRNYFGFTRRWEQHSEEDHDVLREAVNFPIQSVAWNLVQMSLIKIDEALGRLKESISKDGLVLQVYDAICAEVRDEYVDSVAELMYTIMTTINKPFPGLNRVNLLADFQTGKSLKILQKYERKVLTIC
jgi:DNA polymerase-1